MTYEERKLDKKIWYKMALIAWELNRHERFIREKKSLSYIETHWEMVHSEMEDVEELLKYACKLRFITSEDCKHCIDTLYGDNGKDEYIEAYQNGEIYEFEHMFY